MLSKYELSLFLWIRSSNKTYLASLAPSLVQMFGAAFTTRSPQVLQITLISLQAETNQQRSVEHIDSASARGTAWERKKKTYYSKMI